MLIKDLVRRENNNIDLLRLVAALGVIYGHAYAITPQPPLTDFLGAHIAGEYSGSIAVKFFFFLSGLVVSNSFVRNPNLLVFAGARFVRLVPALAVCLLLTTWIIAPIMSTMPLSQYFFDEIPRQYTWLGLTFRPEWALPGVFQHNPTTAVNGSLWTLPIELRCYVTLFVFAAFGMFHKRTAAWVPVATVMLIVCFMAAGYSGLITEFITARSESAILLAYFFAGTLMCLLADRMSLSIASICGLWALVLLTKSTLAFSSVIVVAILLTGLWLSGTSLFRAIRLPGDYSYGTYLYGFFVQQSLKFYFPMLDLRLHQVLSMVLAVVLGAVSWHLLEKPAMLGWKNFTANKIGWGVA